MKNLLRTPFFLFAAVWLSVSVPADVFADSSRRVSIETIRDLKLSGYNEDSDGTLQWRLEADAADADPTTKSADIKRALWNLHKLKLFTFGKNGEVFVEMLSPEGRFSPEKREADSDAKVEVRGENFTVRGTGWSWTGKGHNNRIGVRNDVFVSITLPERAEKINVTSGRLMISGTDSETTLTFSGNVNVTFGEILMSSDSLEIVVPESGHGTSKIRKSEGASDLKIVRSITGRGNVKISRDASRLSGEVAEFFPQENLFRIRRNAELHDSAARISVHGDEAVGKIDQNFVEILSSKPNTTLPGAPVAVSVKMPSVVEREPDSASVPGSEYAVVTGKRMTVFSSEEKNVISLFDEVRMSDSDIRIDADKLVVVADPSEKSPFLGASDVRDDDLGKVRSAVAEGNVRADYQGRVLYCERADVFPQQERITLTGTPHVVSEEENSSLWGDRVEVFLDRDVIEVFSEENEEPDRRRVEVDLPNFADVSANAKPSASAGTTKVFGDHLTLTRGADLSTFDIFGNVSLASDTLTGTCRRILVYADPKKPAQSGVRGRSGLSQIKKIIADGNVLLKQNGYELSGGRASITPAVQLHEWVAEDRSTADGRMPYFVAVDPEADTGTRPRITFPGGTDGSALEFALPAGKKNEPAAEELPVVAKEEDDFFEDLPLSKKKEPEVSAVSESAEPAKKTYLESDVMELVAGERRARFFLRGDVILVTEGGANGMCESVEGLLAPQASDEKSGGFEAKKVICRGNVRLAHDGSTGKGDVFEIFPPENRAVLSGNAAFREKRGIELRPGNDRFVFDLATRQMITGDAAGTGEEMPAQVSRPQIIIPKGSDRVFVIPKSVRGKSEK